MQSVFKLFDRDNNGSIDVDEILVLMKKMVMPILGRPILGRPILGKRAP